MEIDTISNYYLDSSFDPEIHFFEQYLKLCKEFPSQLLNIWILDDKGKGSHFELPMLQDEGGDSIRRTRYMLERVIKILLWQRGGCRVILDSREDLVRHLAEQYCPGGVRAFDEQFFSQQIYGQAFHVEVGSPSDDWRRTGVRVDPTQGKQGCRVGFDLGGSDRKCAALIDGEVIFSEEIPWSPYYETDPYYHINGIRDSIKCAANHLPCVDSIGGSSAGVFIDGVPRVASLFRGLDPSVVSSCIRPFFRSLSDEWQVPVTVLNDGEVTALGGAMWLGKKRVLGLAMGTSLAAGYVDENGEIGGWLNELAFVPVDNGQSGARDEWSGDLGCGVQYFSQQAVFRLAPMAGIELNEDMSATQKLRYVQNLAEAGQQNAIRVFATIGYYLGHAIPMYGRFYDFDDILLLGRVVTGVSGDLIREHAMTLLKTDFPEIAERVRIHFPDETFKRHGQAIIAASLPTFSVP